MVAPLGLLGILGLGGVGAGIAGGLGYGFGIRYGFERLFPAFQEGGPQRAVLTAFSDITTLLGANQNESSRPALPDSFTVPPLDTIQRAPPNTVTPNIPQPTEPVVNPPGFFDPTRAPETIQGPPERPLDFVVDQPAQVSDVDFAAYPVALNILRTKIRGTVQSNSARTLVIALNSIYATWAGNPFKKVGLAQVIELTKILTQLPSF